MTTELSKESIYQQFHERVLSYIRARIGAGDAEDVTADVFVKVMASLDSFDPERNALSTWIYTIANNTLRDFLRRKSVRLRHGCDADEDFLSTLLSDDEPLDSNLLKDEALEQLADSLSALDERQRLVIVMYYYKGIPHKEIADSLGLSYSNERFIAHKAIENLRKSFKSAGLL